MSNVRAQPPPKAGGYNGTQKQTQKAVSYTHLDVYKRQVLNGVLVRKDNKLLVVLD